MTAGAEVGGGTVIPLSLSFARSRARALGRDDVMAHSSGQVVTLSDAA